MHKCLIIYYFIIKGFLNNLLASMSELKVS